MILYFKSSGNYLLTQCTVKDYAIGSLGCQHCELHGGTGKDKQGEFVKCNNSPRNIDIHAIAHFKRVIMNYLKITKIREK
jgi:hypothetical protein